MEISDPISDKLCDIKKKKTGRPQMGSLIKAETKKGITNPIRNKKIIHSLYHFMGDLNVVAY